MPLPELSPDTARFLLEIGLVGVGSGQSRDAELIFDALQALRPDSEHPVLGSAILAINKGDPLTALALLERDVLSKQPDHHYALVFMAMALQKQGRNQEAGLILNKILERQMDDFASRLAEALLRPD